MAAAPISSLETLPSNGSNAACAVFCPHNGLISGGATQMFGAQTQGLLTGRLRAVALIFGILAAAWLGVGLVAHTPLIWPLPILATVFFGVAWLLHRRPNLSERTLRLIELGIFGSMLAHLIVMNIMAANEARESGNLVMAMARHQGTGISFFGLIIAYGMFVPNTWRRAAVMTLPVVAVAAALLSWEAMNLPAPAAPGQTAPESPLYAGLLLFFGELLAVGAAHFVHTGRRRAFDAAAMGTYQLTEKIGAGGMGEVWKAQHRLLARPAAIKIIRPEVLGARDGGGNAQQRFEREAQTTAALRSPHTIELYDFGVTDAGVLFYVMEFLDGLDLESLIERFGPVPEERAIHLLRQAAESLAEAHERGLVHRDIKPSNLYVCSMGLSRDFVKVLDFGLVKNTEMGTEASATLTREGTTTGTPAYMAPELAVGEDGIDHRADIYALGCVGYWLLTGCLVFESDTPMAMIIDHARTPAPPPSSRTEVPISAELDRTILSCLAKDPRERPASLEAFIEELNRCERASGWTSDRATQWWQTHLPKAPTTSRPRAN